MKILCTINLLTILVPLGVISCGLIAHSESLELTNENSAWKSQALPSQKEIWPPAKQSELPDVTAQDPNATNFLPKTLILSGRINESRTTGYPIEWCGDSFELAILDSTNYYYKEWRDQKDKSKGQMYGSEIFVIQGDSAARWTCFQPRLGPGIDCGGGKFSARSMANILPARNFWADNTFLGVKPDNQKIEIFGGDRTEKYLDLEKFGSYFFAAQDNYYSKIGSSSSSDKRIHCRKNYLLKRTNGSMA